MTDTNTTRLNALYNRIRRLEVEIKSPADEHIQDALEIIYELFGIVLAED
jgi:hypothetical protein